MIHAPGDDAVLTKEALASLSSCIERNTRLVTLVVTMDYNQCSRKPTYEGFFSLPQIEIGISSPWFLLHPKVLCNCLI